jgi:hypothetical protein
LHAAVDFPHLFPPDLQVVAFIFEVLLVVLEALLLAVGEVGFFFVMGEVGFFFVAGHFFFVDFGALLFKFALDGAMATPNFCFLLLPIPFFAAFAFFMLALPNFASSDWTRRCSSSIVLATSSWISPLTA